MSGLYGNNPEMWLRRGCEAGSSFWFMGDPPFPSTTRHMFFVIGWHDANSLILVNATSKVKKTLYHLEKALGPFDVTASDVSVRVDQGRYACITKPTLINCYEGYVISVNSLLKGTSLSPIDNPPGVELFQEIVPSWLRSPRVSRSMKEPILRQWNDRGYQF